MACPSWLNNRQHGASRLADRLRSHPVRDCILTTNDGQSAEILSSVGGAAQSPEWSYPRGLGNVPTINPLLSAVPLYVMSGTSPTISAAGLTMFTVMIPVRIKPLLLVTLMGAVVENPLKVRLSTAPEVEPSDSDDTKRGVDVGVRPLSESAPGSLTETVAPAPTLPTTNPSVPPVTETVPDIVFVPVKLTVPGPMMVRFPVPLRPPLGAKFTVPERFIASVPGKFTATTLAAAIEPVAPPAPS